MKPQVVVASVLSLLSVSMSLPGWAASPSLGGIMPRGAQRGTEVEFSLSGARLADVQEALFYKTGLTVKEIKAEKPELVKLKLAIAPDAELGEHYVRLRAASGLTEVKTLWVSQYPNVDEKEPNTDFKTPQVVPLNSTIEGVAENEDVDYFAVEVKKGQRLSAEVEGLRLNGNFWDPYVAIMDQKRFELAAADDTPLLAQDTFAQIVAPEDGTYIVQIRDGSYVGNGGCRYRLHIGQFPRPTAVYPAGGKVGSEVEVSFLGDKSGVKKEKVKLPDQVDPTFRLRQKSEDGQFSPTGNVLRVSSFDNVLEIEPNNDVKSATPFPAGTALPIAFNGILETAGDVDFFRFSAKKDQKFTFMGYGKAIRTAVDPVIDLFQADGKHLGGNDDGAGPDAKFDFTAPADGDYCVMIRDHLNRGGADFVYRIEASVPEASLTLSIPEFARNDYQSRQMMPVAKGNRVAAIVIGSRANFGGDLAFECADLPQGVKLLSDIMPQSSGGGYPIVFEAAADAPVAGKLCDLAARPIDEKLKHIRGGFQQKLDLMMGEPNNTAYYTSIIKKMAVAVVEEVPFKIDVESPKVPLVHNGTLDLKVKATRKEGFKAPITLRMMWYPPNVGGQPTIAIPEGQAEAVYTINANGNAEARAWKLAIQGESDAGQGPILASSDLIPVSIAPSYVGMKIEMAATEQGKPVNVICKLDVGKPWEGEATVTLNGLPAKAVTTPLKVTKDTKEFHFPVTTAADTPAGKHAQLFCSLSIPEAGTIIPHNVGHGGVFRVDTPPPAPKTPDPAAAQAAAKPATPPPAAAPAEKQLSRLEKLRLEAQGKK